jgi:hypothetical protein
MQHTAIAAFTRPGERLMASTVCGDFAVLAQLALKVKKNSDICNLS